MQGDSLSMYAFILATQEIVAEIAEKYECVFYADDGLLLLKPEDDV